ncbi:hypothetical protein CAPTEDRAFT_195082 [Capitella teleta]|uniref:HSF-type DNA-binding domain-containing protein n=1 Tax=Capitella teleta TaxID=283909 RepID=R7TXD2_CAPTE|nr:hypothetical protein CAPTEDRAFT_195082 [Capitella teleta]|eukprot:ELT96106.1 hypothetical protein CAPTEDRAFT_195082 [Capitella teleta]
MYLGLKIKKNLTSKVYIEITKKPCKNAIAREHCKEFERQQLIMNNNRFILQSRQRFSRKAEKRMPFIEKLWEAVQQSNLNETGIFRWINGGTGFEANGEKFEAEVQKVHPDLVAVSNFTNFKRQMSRCGFKCRFIGSPWRWTFHHPSFRADNPRKSEFKIPQYKKPKSAPSTPVGKWECSICPGSPVMNLCTSNFMQMRPLLAPIDGFESPPMSPMGVPVLIQPNRSFAYLSQSDVSEESWFLPCLPYAPVESWGEIKSGYRTQSVLLPSPNWNPNPDDSAFKELDRNLGSLCMDRPDQAVPRDAEEFAWDCGEVRTYFVL